MKTIKVNSEVSYDFGSYVGHLTLILKVITLNFNLININKVLF